MRAACLILFRCNSIQNVQWNETQGDTRNVSKDPVMHNTTWVCFRLCSIKRVFHRCSMGPEFSPPSADEYL